MRKSRILGCALTLAATLVVGGAMGQLPNYKEIRKATIGDNTTGATTLEDTAYVQVGLKYGFYAKPDAAFHPGYNAATNTGFSKDFAWEWTLPTGTSFTPSGAANNYVELSSSNPAVTEKITVVEKAPTAWGISCTSGFDFYVTTFPAPSFSLSTGGDENTKTCQEKDAKVYFDVLSTGTPHIKYTIEKAKGKVETTTGNIIPDGAYTGTPSTQGAFTDANDNWNYSVSKGTKTKAIAANADGLQFEVTEVMSSKANRLAKYKLLIQKVLDPAAETEPITIYRITLNQANGLLSRNADFTQTSGAAGTTEAYFPATAITASATNSHLLYVVKAPKTGPVYHIGNNTAK